MRICNYLTLSSLEVSSGEGVRSELLASDLIHSLISTVFHEIWLIEIA